MNELSEKLVSVIIPVYNGEKYIGETIESVLSQSYHNWELIIVDDGSTDNLKEIAGHYVKQDPRIKYYYHKNNGVSSARNIGIKESRGDLIALLDADDLWLRENLALKVEKIGKGPYGLVHSDGIIFTDTENDIGQLSGMEGWLLDDLLLWEGTQVPGPSSILVRKEVIGEVGMFDENMSTTADKDFFIRVAAKYRIGRVNQPTWKYRVHQDNMHNAIGRMEKDLIYLYKKLSDNRLFKDRDFERKCYSTMHFILAASWLGDGKNPFKFTINMLNAFFYNPSNFFNRLIKQKKR